jgi:two-component system chemotaxis sensor kinase CheA
MTRDPLKYFRPEARDLVDQFAQGMLELEKGRGTAAAVQRLLRVAHTLKGAARVVKQTEIANRAHAIEDALLPFRDSEDAVARDQLDAILEHLDDIGGRIGSLSQPEPAVKPAQRKADLEEAAKEAGKTVRTDVAEADAVLDGVAETHALLNKLRSTAQVMERTRHLTEVLVAQLAQAGGQGARGAGAAPSRRAGIAAELTRKFGVIERDFGSTIDQMDRELRQLREAAERLRLVAAGTLFIALERTALDSARALGKKVEFEGRGGDIRLDAHVLETIQGALIQIVRNAVAHGIEAEHERRSAGKASTGRICVQVARRGRQIVFVCHDDGRGVDLEAVHRLATERGLLKGAGGKADAQSLVQLLLRGGISTSASVTDVAGRGVGLDVVRESVGRLGGEVVVRTERHQGTTIELVIPPSLASMDALVIEADGTDGAPIRTSVPLDSVRSTLRIAPSEISSASQGHTIVHDRQAIPFVPLVAALEGAPWSPHRSWTAVVVAGGKGLAAIGVDRMLGASRIVARPLPQHLSASPIMAGASLDAEGNPQLVLDPEGLIAAAERGSASDHGQKAADRPILVIDDSLTTRMLEQSILESAGYAVDVAISAEEGLGMLRARRYALILVDVEMPGMDGFTFIERIRGDALFHDIPAILVTSRVSPEDLQRGRDAGANGHIAKSEFDQAELLVMIERLTR